MPRLRRLKLLAFIDSISGKNSTTGQHCAQLVVSTRLSVVHCTTKYTPALFGQDFGFDLPGYWDGINYRQRIVDEAIHATTKGSSSPSCGMLYSQQKMNRLI